MSLNQTVSAERTHIAFFGMRNAGKSSLVNAVTGQKLSVVSDVAGTTTDPVKKAMEILPLGPVLIIDTPGFDDVGSLGALRVEKTNEILAKTDIAVLVVDSAKGLSAQDEQMIKLFEARELPYIIAWNKSDVAKPADIGRNAVAVSALTGEGVNELKERIAAFGKKEERVIVADILPENAVVVLVMPIDESAPKGRLILPQQLVLRELLDYNCRAVCCQPSELKGILDMLNAAPNMVITDSQVFGIVSQTVPREVPLTSFSILMARYRGELTSQIKGADTLKKLRDGDLVMISEGCTHHRQCRDIGSVKIPGWIEDFCGAKPKYVFTSGGGFPADVRADYPDLKLIVHCGGCMLPPAEMHSRALRAEAAEVPMVNYGIAIAAMHGILKRSIEPIPEVRGMI
ncbi:MAG: [Clostridia bacterium]|nr:[FeFe] hydrogenase H-cluster maturation GTPase HydF [Clostridia bacterium]